MSTSATSAIAFGLGSNVGDSQALLSWALEQLRSQYGPLKVAPLYRTAPISSIPQPDFLNTVALAELPTDADPREILARAKRLEHLAGRRKSERNGPRPLDIDLLLFGDQVLTGDQVSTGEQVPTTGPAAAEGDTALDLTLPHPRMRQRRFVLAPLNDLAPELRVPPDGARVSDLLAALDGEQRVERISWR